ncbi:MAG: GNAT family N-acetyltransferase [Rhodospirillales bacterium]|nr:GNAT family N-acetyltransferase [Rhodospirillales bacterium]
MDGTEQPRTGAFTPIIAGGLEARLAHSEADIDAAQALRYRVFFDEMGAHPSRKLRTLRRDFDDFDAVCDHILVIDRDCGDPAREVVGTYRVLRRSQAAAGVGFYSSGEYDIFRLEAYPGEILELGRSCVDERYRTLSTMQLLWRSIAAYVTRYEIGLLFGCASLPGTDPVALGPQLSYLYHYHLAPPALRPRALPGRYTEMRLVAEEDVDPRRAMSELPPLIKGYLRLGGFIGDGAVIDHQFNTTDVSVIVKTDLITEKYVKRYEKEWRGNQIS